MKIKNANRSYLPFSNLIEGTVEFWHFYSLSSSIVKRQLLQPRTNCAAVTCQLCNYAPTLHLRANSSLMHQLCSYALSLRLRVNSAAARQLCSCALTLLLRATYAAVRRLCRCYAPTLRCCAPTLQLLCSNSVDAVRRLCGCCVPTLQPTLHLISNKFRTVPVFRMASNLSSWLSFP